MNPWLEKLRRLQESPVGQAITEANAQTAASSLKVPPIEVVQESEPEAVTWLRTKLITPQRIAPLVAAWVGERDGSTGRWIDDLMQARWALKVEAYIGEDDRFWWRLTGTSV